MFARERRAKRAKVWVACGVVWCWCLLLQGEHGTGRNIAPFVEVEWGRQATAIMQRIKDAFDPNNLLNPGVIRNPVGAVSTELADCFQTRKRQACLYNTSTLHASGAQFVPDGAA